MWRTASHTPPLIVFFLAGSMALHGAVLGVLPGFSRYVDPPPIVLEARLQQPVPLPMAPPENETPPSPRKPQQKPVRAAPGHPEHNQPAPVLALPAAQAPAESAFTVSAAAPVPSEPAPAPAQKQQVASIAVTPPTYGAAYQRNPAPAYPAAARRNGVQGTVTLKVVVTAEGLPARVELEMSSGSMHLDNAALEAVKAWRFFPARRGTEPVEGIVSFPIVFRLENSS